MFGDYVDPRVPKLPRGQQHGFPVKPLAFEISPATIALRRREVLWVSGMGLIEPTSVLCAVRVYICRRMYAGPDKFFSGGFHAVYDLPDLFLSAVYHGFSQAATFAIHSDGVLSAAVINQIRTSDLLQFLATSQACAAAEIYEFAISFNREMLVPDSFVPASGNVLAVPGR